MITAHVPAVRVRPDHPCRCVTAVVAARGGAEDRRNPDPAPSARRPAAAAAGPGEAQLGGPCPARCPARQDRPAGDPAERQSPGPTLARANPDLATIIDHLAAAGSPGEVVIAA